MDLARDPVCGSVGNSCRTECVAGMFREGSMLRTIS